MTDKPGNKPGTNHAHDRSTAGKTGEKPGAKTEGLRSPTGGTDQAPSNSGLDVSGQFRVGERISIGVRGSDIVLIQSHSGREVVVAEAALAGLLNDTYFVDKVD